MLNAKRLASLIAVAALSSTVFASGAQAAVGATGTAADFGAPVAGGSADYQVVIAANAKSINVADGETVLFVKDGKSFAWHFSTFGGESTLALAKIAPAGFDAAGVKVYVDADPLYQN
jgi:hypothetical protein